MVRHAADCTGARMDQSVDDRPEEEIRVTTWRCPDCGSFATHEEPWVADVEQGREDGGSSGVRQPRNPSPTPGGAAAPLGE